MKNFFTLMLVAAAAFSASAQVAFSTNAFSGAMAPWTTVDNSGNGAGTWKFDNTPPLSVPSIGSLTFSSPTAATGYVYFMSDAASNDNKPENADLISPALNCTGHSYVFLQFNHYFQQAASSVGTVSVSTDGTNWNQVYMIDATTDNSTVTSIDITSYAANQATVYIKFNYQGNWDYFWMVDDVKLVEPAPLDIAVDKISLNQYVGLGNQTVTGVVSNQGGNTITSFDLAYTDNGGAAISQSFGNLSIAPLQTYTFNFTTPVNMQTASIHNISVSAIGPNGGNDANTNNNNLAKQVTSLSAMPEKNVLVEEFTTAVCQYCPRGTTTVEEILTNHPNDVIAVALHAGFGTDAMTIADHSTVANAYADGAPTACIDRVLFPGESSVAVSTNVWEPYTIDRTSVVTPVSIFADNAYNTATRELTVNASAKFWGPVNDNYRINCYIVEDSVTGSGSGYNQVNAYNTVSSSEWYGKGNPIVGFVHRHVVRSMMGGAWGSSGVISNPTTDKGVYTKQYTATLPAGWNTDHVHLVVLVQHYSNTISDREVLNAMELELNSFDSTAVTVQNPTTGVKEVPAGVNALNIYPNPATDVLNVTYTLNNDANVSFDIYNLLGQKAYSMQPSSLGAGSFKTTVNTSDFKNGVYFISVKENGKVVNTIKFVVNK